MSQSPFINQKLINSFVLFYGAFDAVILVSSIYIFFPQEHPELPHISAQHLQWAIERFATMQSRNPLAKSADIVLRAVFDKVSNMSKSRTTNVDSEIESCSSPEYPVGSSVSEPNIDLSQTVQPMDTYGVPPGDLGDQFQVVLSPDTVWHFSNMFP